VKKHTERKGKRLRVSGIQYVSRRDTDERLSRVVDILLRAAARKADKSKESQNTENKKPPRQAPAKDAPIGGAEERG